MSLNGHIDRVTPEGFVQGWAHRAGSPEAVTVLVQSDGETVAQAVADLFRMDLVEAGMGHGHYTFNARLTRTIPPGDVELNLVDAESGENILSGPMTVKVPKISPRRRLSVEDLLSAGVQWTDEDVLECIDVLNLEKNFRQMGAKRFVDAVFQFALGRGADPAAIAGYTPVLLSGKITPAQVLKDVLGSEERRNSGGALPSPHETRYPFSEAVGQGAA